MRKYCCWNGPAEKEAEVIASQNLYAAIVEAVFHAKHQAGSRTVHFVREDITASAAALGIRLPKNLGDVIYSFRYRAELPASILDEAPTGKTWIIRPTGRGTYCFALVNDTPLTPNPNLVVTKIPDATPGLITKYAFNDEQAVLARVRYNRLLDIFLGIACYSLQNHFRTTVAGIGQIETDEVYVGVDKGGRHYVAPVQAKGTGERLGRVQVEQDIALCADRLPSLICRPIGVQSIHDDIIALFEFEQQDDEISIVAESHYTLVSPEAITHSDLEAYRTRLAGY